MIKELKEIEVDITTKSVISELTDFDGSSVNLYQRPHDDDLDIPINDENDKKNKIHQDNFKKVLTNILNGKQTLGFGGSVQIAPEEDEEEFHVDSMNVVKQKPSNENSSLRHQNFLNDAHSVSSVAPEDNVVDSDVMSFPIHKPKPKEIKPNGKVNAVQFMIQERQQMDAEQAKLRKENAKLKEELSNMIQNSSAHVLKMSQLDVPEELEKELNARISKVRSNGMDDEVISPSRIEMVIPYSPFVQKGPLYSNNKQQESVSEACDQVPSLLWNGSYLWKVPFNGKGPPEQRIVSLKRASYPGLYSRKVEIIDKKGDPVDHSKGPVYMSYPPTLIWYSSNSKGEFRNPRELILYEGSHMVEGHSTPAFWKLESRDGPLPREELCFSVVTPTRTLDLAAESEIEASEWKYALKGFLMTVTPSEDGSYSTLSTNRPSNDKSSDKTVDPSAHLQEKLRQEKIQAYEIEMFQCVHNRDFHRLEEILMTGIVNVNAMEGEVQDTPLMVACRMNDANIVRLCLHFGAKNDPHPDFGQTALHSAVESTSYEAASALLTAAATSNADVIITNLADSRGQSTLHLATANNDVRMIELLLNHGADVGRSDDHGRSALHVASEFGHFEALAILLDLCSDGLLDQQDYEGNTPLHKASAAGKISCARLLLETAANVFAKNKQHQTAYNIACEMGHHEVGLLLLDYQDQMDYSKKPVNQPSYRYNERPDDENRSLAEESHQYVNATANPLPRPHHGSVHKNQAAYGKLFEGLNVNGEFDQHNSNSTAAPHFNEPYEIFHRKVDHFHSPEATTSPSSNSYDYSNGNKSYEEKLFLSPNEKMSVYETELSYATTDYSSPSFSNAYDTSYYAEETEPYGAVTVEYEQSALDNFECCNMWWQSYVTDEGYTYYISEHLNHSQWEDPREFGVIYGYDDLAAAVTYDVTAVGNEKSYETLNNSYHQTPTKASPTGRNGLPPKSPRAKAFTSPKKLDYGMVHDNYSYANKGGTKKNYRKDNNKARGTTSKRLSRDSELDDYSTLQSSLDNASSEEDEEDIEGMLQSRRSRRQNKSQNRLQKYIDMLESGKSLRVVRRAMEDAQETEKRIIEVLSLYDTHGSMNSSRKSKPDQTSLDELKYDSVLGKYAKMMTMGIPIETVITKMKLDDVYIGDIAKLKQAYDIQSLSTRRNDDDWIASPQSSQGALGSGNKSIWKANRDTNEGSTILGDLDQIKQLFGSPTKGESYSSDMKRNQLLVIDNTRAQNITIALRSYKNIGSTKDILTAICTFDTMDGNLLVDHLENFVPLLLTASEWKRLPEISKSSHPAEIFLAEAAEYYPELSRRLQCFITCHHFQSSCEIVMEKSDLLILVCDKVLNSENLVRLFQMIQAVSVVVRPSQTPSSRSAGMKLDTLLKVLQTKGTDRKTTVLDYVIKNLIEKGEGRLLDVIDELESIPGVTKISNKDIINEIDQLQSQFNNLDNELKCSLGQLNRERLGKISYGIDSVIMTSKFCERLDLQLEEFRLIMNKVIKIRQQLQAKINDLMDYFGEDNQICDTISIFVMLESFRSSLITGRESFRSQLISRSSYYNHH